METAKQILFITATRIGDAVLSTAILEEIKRRQPQAHFTICCGELVQDLFRADPQIDRIIPIRKKKYGGHWIDLWKKVRSTHWDAIYDLRSSVISLFLTSQARFRLKKKEHGKSGHKIHALGAVLSPPPPSATPLFPNIAVDDIAIERAAHFLETQAPPKAQTALIGLGLGANWVGKQWPVEKYSELAKIINRKFDQQSKPIFMLLGGPMDTELATKFIAVSGLKNVLDATRVNDLVATAYLCSKLDLFIGNDSGLMHLAAAMRCRTIGLFGPSNDIAYRPYGERNLAIRGSATFEDYLMLDPKLNQKTCWINDLQVEMVVTEISSVINTIISDRLSAANQVQTAKKDEHGF